MQVRDRIQNLGADVDIDATRVKIGTPPRPVVQLECLVHRHAELAPRMAGAGVLVWGRRQDVRVHADREGGYHPEPGSHPIEALELAATLHVEGMDARPQPLLQLELGLAHSGVEDALGWDSRPQGSVELT